MGLEPTTSTLQRSHSSQLSYAPVSVRRCRSGMHTVPADRESTALSVATRSMDTPATRDSRVPRRRRHMPAVRSHPRTSSVRTARPVPLRSLRSPPPPGRAVNGVPPDLQEYPWAPPTATELLDTLTEGIEALTTSETWRAHLEVQGRFHHYSFNNALLIGAQDPGATRVAGLRHLEEARPLGRARGSAPSGSSPRWSAGGPGPPTARSADRSRIPAGGRVRRGPDRRATRCPRSAATCEGEDPAPGSICCAARAERLGYSVESGRAPGWHRTATAPSPLRRIRVECRNAPGPAGQDPGPRTGPRPPPRGHRRPGAGRTRGGVDRLRGVPAPRARLRGLLLRLRRLLGRRWRPEAVARHQGVRRQPSSGRRRSSSMIVDDVGESAGVAASPPEPDARRQPSVARPVRSSGRSPPRPPRPRRIRRPRCACGARGPCRPRRSGRSRR